MLDLSTLTEDGDILKIDDTRSLRLSIAPDEYSSGFDYINNDCDTWGKVAFCDTRQNDYGRYAPRPEGFDGNAEKLHIGRGNDAVWWQPNEDVKRNASTFRQERAYVVDILEYGTSIITLELREGTDAYGQPIVIDVASLAGIEPFADDAYIATIVEDLASELEGLLS